MKLKVTNIKQGENNFDKKRLEKIIKPEILDVDPENCPADALMNKVRKKFNKKTGDFKANVEFSEQSIQFFKDNADKMYEKNKDEIYFYWAEIPEESLPPLIVEIIKKEDKYILKDLKELDEEEMLNIKGAKCKDDKMTYLRKLFIKKSNEELEK